MSSLIMQVASPKPKNYLRNLNFVPKSSKLRRAAFRFSRGMQPRCSSQVTQTPSNDHRIETGRRSGGYQPTLWDFDAIQSLNSEYKEESHKRRAAELIEQVKMFLREEDDHVRRLQLIDDLHWLGISCHFENEITRILQSAYSNYNNDAEIRDLYSTSLEFRLLREHGFRLPQEVFDCFKNETGVLKPSLGGDIKGVLELYEASFLQTPGEETLEQARVFATGILLKAVDDHQIDDDNLLSQIQAALKLPSHWRIQIPNVRSYIDAYKRRPDMNPVVLELSKLDINILQAQYQEELKEVTRWWKSTKLVQHLPFARDRIVECHLWSIGFIQPRHRRYERIMMAKVNIIITFLDDIFDVYGTLEELHLFTNAIRRWDDIDSIKQLPNYMQLCYLALYNFINESAYDNLKEKGFNPAPFLRKAWGDLIESYIIEANWFYGGYKPSVEEYLNNAWISVGAVQIISHIYFWATDPLEEEGAQIMHKYHDLVRNSSMILRLADDLGTSLDEVERGDVPKSIQCYMNENEASEEDARAHVRFLIREAWKRINAEMMREDSPFSKEFIAATANVGRMAQFMYQDELDGFGVQNSHVHKLLRSLLFEHYM